MKIFIVNLIAVIFLMYVNIVGTTPAQQTPPALPSAKSTIVPSNQPPLYINGQLQSQPQVPITPPSNIVPASQLPLHRFRSAAYSVKILSNAVGAVRSAETLKKYLYPGKVWIIKTPNGSEEVKAALLYQGRVVTILRFDARNGTILPTGYIQAEPAQPPIDQAPVGNLRVSTGAVHLIESSLPVLISNLEILRGAEYLSPENAWLVSLSYKEMIVGKVKIYRDGSHVIPDYAAEREIMNLSH